MKTLSVTLSLLIACLALWGTAPGNDSPATQAATDQIPIIAPAADPSPSLQEPVSEPALAPGASNSKPDGQTRTTYNWTGAMSQAWNLPANWTPLGIPGSTDDVIIGGMVPPMNMPMITTSGAVCRSLVNNGGMILMITPPGTLRVYGQVDNYGNIDMHNIMTVDTNLILHPGSMLNSANPTAQLTVNGNCYLDNGSQMSMNAGTFIMSGSGSGTFTSRGGVCSFFDVYLNKSIGNIAFSSASITPVEITHNLTVGTSTTCNIEMDPDLVLTGNLLVNSGGHLYCLQGRVYCNGGGTVFQTINLSTTDSYFHNLLIDGSVSLASNMTIKVNICLSGGVFSPGNYTVYLKGDWVNEVGPSAFAKGSSRVVFNGTVDQTVSLPLTSTEPEEEFHIIEVNKLSGSLLLDTAGQTVSCDIYDWTAGSVKVTNGSLVILSLYDIYISGTFYLYDPGTISITCGGLVRLGCSLYIYGGTFTIRGGSADAQWPASSGCGITMYGGLLYFHDVGVVVDDAAIPFTENISGGIIRVNGGFQIQRPDFHPSGGTIEFVGPNPATIGMVPGAWFYSVLVNKSAALPPSPAPRNPSRDTTLYSTSDLDINGSLGVQSGSGFDLDHFVDVQGPTSVSGSVWVRMPGTGVPSLDMHNGVDIEIGSHWVLVAYVWVKVEGPVPYPAQNVDGELEIEGNAKWESCSAPMNVGSSGSIVFIPSGTEQAGRVICPGFAATYPGTFVSLTGTLELTGDPDVPRYLNVTAGNHCCDLLINSEGPIVLDNDCDILGDLHIQQGTLDVSLSNYAVNLYGSWLDDMAPTGFERRNGTVSFLGSGSSDIATGGEEESFFDVIINKSGAAVSVSCPGCCLHIYGGLDVLSDSFFDIYTEITLDGDLDLWGDLQDNDCDIIIHGYPHLATGSELRILGTDGRVLCDAPSLAMPPLSLAGYVLIQDGTLEVTQMPVSVASSGNVYFVCGGGGGGGCLKCPSFQALTPGTFVPGCGTLEMTGTGPVSARYLNIATGNHCCNLLLNEGLVVLQNDCDIYGDLHIHQGTLDVSTSNYSILLRGSWTDDVAPSGFNERNGTVRLLGGGGGSGAYINAGGLREEYYNLEVNKPGGSVTTNCEVGLFGDADIWPDSFFDVFYDLDVDGDFLLAGDMVAESAARVEIQGNLEEEDSGTLEIKSPWGDGGYVKYGYGGMNHIFSILAGGVTIQDGGTLDTNRIIRLTSTAHLETLGGGGGGGGGGVICNGFEATYAGTFIPGAGYLEINSITDGIPVILNIGSGNHSHNLIIDSPSPVVLQNDCDIYGDLHIIHGPLDVSTSNREVRLYGSWTDDVAPLGFEARNGTVRLLGGGAGSGADIYTGGGVESFFDVIINKPGSSVTNHCGVHLAGDLDVWADSFFDVFFEVDIDSDLDLWGQLEVESGVTMTVNSLPTLGSASVLIVRLASQLIVQDMLDNLPPIYAQGIIILEDGTLEACNQPIEVASSGHIYFQTTGGGGGGALHCCGLTAMALGTFAPTMGTLEINSDLSGLPQTITLGPGNNAYDLRINTLTTAVLGGDLTVKGDLDVVNGLLDVSTNNYTIMCWGSWSNSSPTQGFLARDCSVHFVGSGDAHISTNKEEELFHNLIVNKTGTVILDDHVATTGDGFGDIILGTLYDNDHTLTISGNCTIGNSGMLFLDGGTCAMGDGRVLTVNSGGTCKAHGNRNRDSKMKGKEEMESHWKLKVNSGGHISAKKTEFKNLREEGIKVDAGGNIDPDADFDECKFNSGAPGCTFLTIDNNQSLTIDNIEFLSGSGELHNIAKTVNSGHILVASSSGNFAGPDHEYDPYNLIDWTGYYPNLVVTQFYASNYDPYVCDPVTYHVQVTNQSAIVIITGINLRLINPATGEYEDHWITGMLGWGVVEIDFTDSSDEPGLEMKEAIVDPDNLIQESNEVDNFAYLPEPVEWHSLPAVSNVDIERLTGTTGRLTWTYPIWASRYKIYASDDPYGAFSYLGATVESFFDVFMANPKGFYLIKAERDLPVGK